MLEEYGDGEKVGCQRGVLFAKFCQPGSARVFWHVESLSEVVIDGLPTLGLESRHVWILSR